MGPGGERVANVGELAVRLRMEQMHQADVMGKVTFQAAKVRKPLLAVSSMTAKNNLLIFHKQHPCMIPANDPVLDKILALVQQAKTRIPLYQKQGMFVMRSWDPAPQAEQSGFTRPAAQ